MMLCIHCSSGEWEKIDVCAGVSLRHCMQLALHCSKARYDQRSLHAIAYCCMQQGEQVDWSAALTELALNGCMGCHQPPGPGSAVALRPASTQHVDGAVGALMQWLSLLLQVFDICQFPAHTTGVIPLPQAGPTCRVSNRCLLFRLAVLVCCSCTFA